MERDFQKAMKGMRAFADSENAIICHAELVSASRSKTRWTLTRPVLRRPSKIMDPSMDKINTKIPKRVRDDKVRNFPNPLPGQLFRYIETRNC